MDWQPCLEDGTVRLRPLGPDDREPLFDVARDPGIWALHPAHDRWQRPVFDRFFDDAMASNGALVVEEAASGRMIGASRFDPARAGPREVEIGWTFLARDHWGGATNRRMKRLMLAHALERVERVIFLVGESNLRSRRAMEKIGGVLTSRTHRAEMAGVPVVHVIYAIDRAGFAAGPLQPA